MKKDSFLGKLVYGYDKLEEYVLCASLVLTTLIIFVQDPIHLHMADMDGREHRPEG